MIKYDREKSCRPDACGMYCNVMERKVMKKSKGKKGNGGFSLVELIIVIAIMAVLVGVLAPQYLSYIHKAKVAADQANLKNYFTEIQMDYITTGKYNSMVPTELNSREDYMQREIHFLNGQTVKLKAGYFAVTVDTRKGGYNICYQCDLCTAADADEQTKQKHLETCMITFL